MPRILLLLLVVGCHTPHKSVPPEPSQDLGRAVSDSMTIEQAVVERTNAVRKRAGVRPLRENPKLAEAARRHAEDMARSSTLSHSLHGRSASDRVKAAGYVYRAVAENIAWNQPTPKAAVEDWMNSRGHRRNMLSDEYAEIGVGMAVNAKGEPYWVQVFGTAR